MASTYNRRINLYINGKQVSNDIKSVQASMTKLRNEQRMMTIGSDEYVRHAEKIRYLKGILDKHNADLRKTERSWISLKGTADKFNRYFGMITAGIASLTGLALGFRKASDEANKFEERLDNLSALTGLEGDQLEWLGEMAKQTSVEITESGIRIKQSAADILDAYTKMGSQRPELLKNKEALHEVTKNAIILSEAAKSELQPAVDGLAMAMNQHNIAATESGRVINSMAAGSKEGAGDIPYLTKAIEKSGTTLSLMNVSLEENIGLIESVAPYYARAELAGNSLDKVFLKMKASHIGYVNGVFSVDAALDELQRRFAKGETSAELFGVEHAKMGELLVKNRSEVDRYTKAVTGTNIAIEQAVKNTNNNAAALAQARNKMNLVLIEFGEKLNPALLKSTNLVTYLIKALIKAPKWFKDNQTLLIALAGAVLAYNAALLQQIVLEGKSLAVKAKNIIVDNALSLASTAKVLRMRIELALMKQNTAAQIAHAGALKKAIMYEQLFGKALLANPIGLIVAGITALVVAIKTYDKYNKEAVERERERKQSVEDLAKANEALKETYDNIGQNISDLNKLSIDEKKDLQDKIDKTLELAEAELTLQQAKQLEIQEHNTEATLWQKTLNLLTSGGNVYIAASNNIVDAAKNGANAAGTMQEGIDNLRERIAGLKRQNIDLGEILNAEKLGDAIGNDTMAQLEEKLNKYNVALKNAVVGGEDYIRIQKKIDDINKLLGQGSENDNTNASDALELAYKQRELILKQQYAGEETLQKEFQARMLANELVYLQAKANLEGDGMKKLELQMQIIDKQLAYNEAVKAAVPELINTKGAVDKLNSSLLEEGKLTQRNAAISAQAATDQERLNEKLTEQANMYQDTIMVISNSLYDMMSGSEDAFKTFAKNILIFALEQLKVQAQLAAAGATVQSLAQPDSIATFGVSGLARAAIIVGLIEAAFAGLEGLVSSAFSSKSTKGYATGGYAYEQQYIVAEQNKAEWIAPNRMLTSPVTGPIIQALEKIRQQPGRINELLPQMAAGGIIGSSVSAPKQSFINTTDPELKKLVQQNTIVMRMLLKKGIAITDVKKKLDNLKDIEDNMGM